MSPERLHDMPARFLPSTLFLLGLALGFLAVLHVPVAHAGSTINVNTTDDEVANDGKCSLREAVTSANTNPFLGIKGECELGSPGLDTIVLPAGTYTLTIPGTGEDNNATGDLDIREDLVIQGAGSSISIVNANEIDRVFDVLNSAHLTLSRMTIEGGHLASSGSGGGLRVNASAVAALTNVLFIANYAVDHGGGLYVASGGSASIDHSSFANNSGNFGGAIGNSGTLTVANASFSWWNPSEAAVSGAGIDNRGGAVTVSDTAFMNLVSFTGGAVFDYGGTMKLNRVTIEDSHASSGDGGGIYAWGPITLTNVTLSGNSASGSGGALYKSDDPYPTTLIHTTVYSNSATTGGSIFRSGTSGSLVLQSTIVYSGASGGGCSGTITSGGYNLGWGNPCAFTAVGDIPNADPLLGPLAMNGGATETHALRAGSPAIDHIPFGVNGCGTTVTTDQRGTSRPVGGKCDIGAFEFVPNLYLPLILK